MRQGCTFAVPHGMHTRMAQCSFPEMTLPSSATCTPSPKTCVNIASAYPQEHSHYSSGTAPSARLTQLHTQAW